MQDISDLKAARRTRVAIVPQELPCHLRPVFPVRHAGVTILFVDPRTPRAEAVAWSVDNLEVPERQFIRDAMGQPPIGEPLEDWIMDDPVCEWWPPALLLPEWVCVPDQTPRERAAAARMRAAQARVEAQAARLLRDNA